MTARRREEPQKIPANAHVYALRPAVAKLQRDRDTLVRLLIRGMDEHAAYRGRGPQQQG